jgi:endoplasmic reticulum-Golgi intermediate compartment protein 3
MDNKEHLVANGQFIHKYFIKVVPTIIDNGFFSKPTITAQISYTEHMQKIEGRVIQLPALFFVYDISPICITYSYSSVHYFALIIRIIGIVGGILTISKFIDKFLHFSLKFLNKKKD